MGFLDSLKDIALGYSDDYENEDYIEGTEDETQEHKESSFMPRFSGKKVVSIDDAHQNAGSELAKVTIFNPVSYKEATNIVDSLRGGKIVIVDLKGMKIQDGQKDEFESQKEIFDFLSGAVYAIDGEIKKLSSTIFVMVPASVDIDTELESESDRKGTSRLPWVSSL